MSRIAATHASIRLRVELAIQVFNDPEIISTPRVANTSSIRICIESGGFGWTYFSDQSSRSCRIKYDSPRSPAKPSLLIHAPFLFLAGPYESPDCPLGNARRYTDGSFHLVKVSCLSLPADTSDDNNMTPSPIRRSESAAVGSSVVN